eukprot:gnl/Carplike_NY0171/1659_a2244_724.p1 GENE.gnl/Carplike_NY0171/1659_a2244_724~~gnl/Carplike_NY0171/1659_a2244_724.p1  ORF type:complete len:638 (-),score=95.81 gnl/Carplike_NY0171/1659_a2244_724:123-2036(-)
MTYFKNSQHSLFSSISEFSLVLIFGAGITFLIFLGFALILPTTFFMKYFNNFCGAVCIISIFLLMIFTSFESFPIYVRNLNGHFRRFLLICGFVVLSMIGGAIYIFLGEVIFRFIHPQEYADQSQLAVGIQEGLAFLLIGIDSAIFRGKLWNAFGVSSQGWPRVMATIVGATIISVFVYAGIRDELIFGGIFSADQLFSIIFSFVQSIIFLNLSAISVWNRLFSRIDSSPAISQPVFTFLLCVSFIIIATLWREGLVLLLTNLTDNSVDRYVLLSHVQNISTELYVPMLLLDRSLGDWTLGKFVSKEPAYDHQNDQKPIELVSAIGQGLNSAKDEECHSRSSPVENPSSVVRFMPIDDAAASVSPRSGSQCEGDQEDMNNLSHSSLTSLDEEERSTFQFSRYVGVLNDPSCPSRSVKQKTTSHGQQRSILRSWSCSSEFNPPASITCGLRDMYSSKKLSHSPDIAQSLAHSRSPVGDMNNLYHSPSLPIELSVDSSVSISVLVTYSIVITLISLLLTIPFYFLFHGVVYPIVFQEVAQIPSQADLSSDGNNDIYTGTLPLEWVYEPDFPWSFFLGGVIGLIYSISGIHNGTDGSSCSSDGSNSGLSEKEVKGNNPIAGLLHDLLVQKTFHSLPIESV